MNMRERMALSVIHALDPGTDDPPMKPEDVYHIVDAALSALAEPTEAMLRDGDMAACSFKGIAGIWRAMIGAAGEG